MNGNPSSSSTGGDVSYHSLFNQQIGLRNERLMEKGILTVFS
jgi:hypothetical protein